MNGALETLVSGIRDDVREIVRTEVAALVPSEVMTLDSFAKWMGVSERTVNTWVKAGMPTMGFRGVIRISRSRAQEWLEDNRRVGA